MDILNFLVAALHVNTDDKPSEVHESPFLYVETEDSRASEYVGKWLVFCDTSEVDSLWLQVKQMVLSGKVWRSAKVSTMCSASNKHNKHVVCIYTYNHHDLNDIYNTNAIIKNELGIRHKLAYKSDEMTLNGEKGSLFYF